MPIAKIFAAFLASCCGASLFAFVADDGSNKRNKVVLRPQLLDGDNSINNISPGVSIKKDGLSGSARLITIVPEHSNTKFLKRTQPAYEHAIRRYVQDNRRLLGIDWRELRIMPDATLINNDVAFFKYNVFRDDIHIEDASLLFRFKKGLLVQVVNNSFAEAQPLFTAVPLRDHELQAILQRELGMNEYAAIGSTWRVTVKDGVYRLVKVRRFRQQFGELMDVQINAHTGEIYEVTPRRYFLASHGFARATLYPRWYREELNLMPLRRVGIDFLNTAGRVVHRAPSNYEGRYVVPNQELSPLLNGVVGAQIKVNNKSGPAVSVNGVLEGKTWQTLIGRQLEGQVSNDKLVAQSMVYYHLQQIVQTASSYVASPWFNRPLTANTNLTRTCNAHWDTLFGTVNFYSGDSRCANTGLIADVIYHEWGHGLDANTGGITDPAFSEGFGDIVSMLMTRSHVVGPDFGLNGRSVRDLEPDRVYPRDVSDSVHSTGLIIGSTFWNLFKTFKKQYSEDETIEILRRYAFQMIFTAERYTDVYDTLLVIDDNDANLSNGTPNLCVLNEVFTRHGLATINGECQLVELVETRSNDQRGNGNGIIEPGETIELNTWLKNTTSRDFTDLRARASSDNTHLQWQNDIAIWDHVASGNTMSSDTPLLFTLSDNMQCGESFTVNLDFNIGNKLRNFSTELYVGKHTGTPDLHQAEGMPHSIPDRSSTEVSVFVQGQQWRDTTSVYAAQVKFNLFHFAHQELLVELIAPDGKAVRLFNGKAGFGTLAVEQDISEQLRGQLGQGEWRLRVIDRKKGTVGYLVNFALTLTPHVFTCQR